MSIEIGQPVLRAAVERLSVVNETSKVPLEAYSNFRLQGFGSHLKLATFNRLMTAEVRIDTDSPHEPFVSGVSLKALKELVPLLPEADRVRLEIKANKCSISCGGASFNLKLVPGDAFPPRYLSGGRHFDYSELSYTDLSLREFFEAIGKVIYCTEPASDRIYARGVVVTPSYFFGTDGRRLARYPNRILPVETPYVIPVEALARLQKLYKGATTGGIAPHGGEDVYELSFASMGIYATTRLLSTTLPDVGRVVPVTKADVFAIPKEPLLAALQRALILVNDKIPVSELHFSQERLRIRTDNDGNTSEESLAYSGLGTQLFQVNPRYLYEAVQRVDSEDIFFQLRGPDVAVIVTDAQGEHINAVMPRRVER